jgi:hypothetical protein
MRSGFNVLIALAFLCTSSAVLFAGEGKDGSKCCAKEGAEKLVSLSSEKALAVAKQIRAEACPVKSSEILASALPGLSCKDTLAKLTSDVKAKGCEKEAAQVILTAFKQFAPKAEAACALCPEKAAALVKLIRAESCPVKSSEILASALPGLSCKETLAKLTSEIKAKGCDQEAAAVVLAAAQKYTLVSVKSDSKLCALKAQTIAASIRAESCPVKSSEILASALPALKCKETLAKLVTDIKAKGCEKEAAELILAAQAKLEKSAEPEKKN